MCLSFPAKGTHEGQTGSLNEGGEMGNLNEGGKMERLNEDATPAMSSAEIKLFN